MSEGWKWLNEWEAEAKGIQHGTKSAERILALIDLVRKKDEVLKQLSCLEMTYDQIPNECRWACALAREALALTEQLK